MSSVVPGESSPTRNLEERVEDPTPAQAPEPEPEPELELEPEPEPEPEPTLPSPPSSPSSPSSPLEPCRITPVRLQRTAERQALFDAAPRCALGTGAEVEAQRERLQQLEAQKAQQSRLAQQERELDVHPHEELRLLDGCAKCRRQDDLLRELLQLQERADAARRRAEEERLRLVECRRELERERAQYVARRTTDVETWWHLLFCCW